jgi:glycosyltransferase involved in cell wall biosynthesis
MLVRLAGALDPGRVRPVVACLKAGGVWADSLVRRGIPIHEGLLRHKYDLGVVGRLRRLLRQHRPACIMPVGSGGDRMFWSTLAGRLERAPVIVWSHLFPVPGATEFEWINRRLLPWVQAVVALGQTHAAALESTVGVRPDRLVVIRNGIETEPLDCPAERGAARESLGLAPQDTAIAAVANLRPIKRPELFVEAAAMVGKNKPTARFFMIGDGPLRSELERRIRDAGLGARIRLLGAREDVPRLLQAMDILCLTSRRECLSVALLEAMAAGRPVVAPRVGSLDEALADGVTGRFFPAEGPALADHLARILGELIDSPAERARLGGNAQAAVRDGFQLDQMARAFEDLVLELRARVS